MRIPYLVGVANRPQPALGGSLVRPRPMMPVPFTSRAGGARRDGMTSRAAGHGI
jgi:hypothetical protein